MVAVVVVENPVPRPFMWATPQAAGFGAPRGQLEFQNNGVEIAAVTADVRTILISMALPIGHTYRLRDLKIDLAGVLAADLEEFGQCAFCTLTAFTPQAPSQTLREVFRLDTGNALITASGALDGYSFPSDASATPSKLIYQGEVPSTLLNAQSGTTVLIVNISSSADTTVTAQLLGYYARFDVYDMAQENRWAINSPTLVVQ